MNVPSPTGDSTAQTLPRNVKVLGLASLLNDIASEIMQPLLPLFLNKYVSASAVLLGTMEGLADSAASLLKLFSGGWSDRLGSRKAFIVAGYALAALARPFTALVTLPWQMVAVRTTDRVGKGIRTSPRDALIAEAAPPHMRGRAFGFHRAMDHLGASIGPMVAFVFLSFQRDQLKPLFLWTLVPGLFVVGLIAFGLKTSQPTTTAKKEFRLTLAPFHWKFRFFLVILVVFTLGNSTDLFLLKRAEELGVSTNGLLLMWCAFHVNKSICTWFAGLAVDRFGPRRMIFLGWLVYAAIYFGFALVQSPTEAVVLFLVYGFYYALTEPAEKTLVAVLAGTEHAGLAFGWYHFVLGIALFPASLLFAGLYDEFGAVAAFGTGSGLALIASVMLLGIRSARFS
jgi:MFS family permease